MHNMLALSIVNTHRNTARAAKQAQSKAVSYLLVIIIAIIISKELYITYYVMWIFANYVAYGTSGAVSFRIQHSASPHADTA